MFTTECMVYQDITAELRVMEDSFVLTLRKENQDAVSLVFSYTQMQVLGKSIQSFIRQVSIQPLFAADFYFCIGGMEVQFILDDEPYPAKNEKLPSMLVKSNTLPEIA